MPLTVIAPFGFSDIEPVSALSAWATLAGVRTGQALRNPDNEPSAEQMVRLARQAGLTLDSLHGLFGPSLDPSSLDEAVRKATVDVYRGEGLLVRQLGGQSVVVHPSPKAPDDGQHEIRRRQLLRSVQELGQIAHDLGVEFLLENQQPGHPIGRSIADLADLIRASRAGGVGCCFDIGHAHMWGDGTAGIDVAGPLLACVHVSDNDGQADQHALCFEGTVDWHAVGRALADIHYAGPVVMEVFLPAAEVARRVTPAWLARLHGALPLEL